MQRLGRFVRLAAHFVGGLVTLAFRFQHFGDQRRLDEIRRWSRKFLLLSGVQLRRVGRPPSAGLIVMNHISWLDVIVLNSVAPSRFVSKAEVAHWPLVGYLCTKSGTLYIERNRKTAARRTNQLITDALARGERVAVFPEGTTTSGDHLLPFHAALLQPAIAGAGVTHPAALRYLDTRGERSRAVSYVGDETLIGSIWQLLGAKRVIARLEFGRAEPATGRNRRELAGALRATIIRHLDLDAPRKEPETHGHPRSGPR